jgi:hypothetical protein
MYHRPHNAGTKLPYRSRVFMVILLLAAVFEIGSTKAQEEENLEGFINGIRANAVKGDVVYEHKDGEFSLEAGFKLQQGNFIKSGANAYVELLLQPGNYLRIGGESECQIISDQYDRMKLKLNQGAVSLEILAKDTGSTWHFNETLSQRYELIRVITPNAEVFITEPGIFRINAPGAARTELIVREGEAFINGRRVRKKRSAVAAQEGVTIVDVNANSEDNFDVWGRERAAQLLRANRSLKNESPWATKRKDGKEISVDVPEVEGHSTTGGRVVSAKAGAVNFVEDGVEFNRPMKEWQPLTENTQLETGDKLRTSSHSFAELTMLPDINLRLAGQSEVLFEQLSNESVSLKLLKGSAIIDVARFAGKQVPQITLGGTSTSVVIADQGNYRIDVKPNGEEIMVRDGKVIFNGRSVGSCRIISGGTVSDCDNKRNDNFDLWSEHRGEGELFDGSTRVATAAHLARLRRFRFKNTGFWFQNPGQTDYTFVPFYSQLFRSPYGGSYSTVLSLRRVQTNQVNIGERPFGRRRGPQIVRPQP